MNYVDLFSGCGGLSLGLETAGFELTLAVEKSPMASETFYFNFIKPNGTDQDWARFEQQGIVEQYKQKLIVSELENVLADNYIMDDLKRVGIDLVAGGPPCQGFSMAGRRDPNDKRNKLPWQFMEFIEATNPKFVLMENVVGISRNFNKSEKEAPFNQLKLALSGIGQGYLVQAVELNAMHFGVPEHRPRMMLLGIRTDLPQTKSMYFADQVWKSSYTNATDNGFERRPEIVPKSTTQGKEVLFVSEVFKDIDENGYKYPYNHESYKENAYANLMRNSDLWHTYSNKKANNLENHVMRKHTQKVIKRFSLYQSLAEAGFNKKVLHLPLSKDLTKNEKEELVLDLINEISFPIKSPRDEILATNQDDLLDLIFELATKKHSQKPLNPNKPSPTVLTLPDDHVHPYYPRIMTVRELARIQSFPDSFVFRSKETTGSERRKFEVPQYSQVGNAVAPLLAYEIGKNFKKIFE